MTENHQLINDLEQSANLLQEAANEIRNLNKALDRAIQLLMEHTPYQQATHHSLKDYIHHITQRNTP